MSLVFLLASLLFCVGCQAPKDGGLAGIYTAQILFIAALFVAGFGIKIASNNVFFGLVIVLIGAFLLFLA